METYAAVMQNPRSVNLEISELHWAHDVLGEYFAVTDSAHPLIARMKSKFESLPRPAEVDKSERFAPYERRQRDDLQIPSYAEFMDLSLKRRSVRWFQDKPVPASWWIKPCWLPRWLTPATVSPSTTVF